MLLNLVLNLFFVLILFFCEILHDNIKFDRGQTVHHARKFATTTAVLSLCLFFAWQLTGASFTLFAAWLGFALASRLAFFDIVLNMSRGKPFNHLGTEALSDRISKLVKHHLFYRWCIWALMSFLLMSALLDTYPAGADGLGIAIFTLIAAAVISGLWQKLK